MVNQLNAAHSRDFGFDDQSPVARFLALTAVQNISRSISGHRAHAGSYGTPSRSQAKELLLEKLSKELLSF